MVVPWGWLFASTGSTPPEGPEGQTARRELDVVPGLPAVGAYRLPSGSVVEVL